MDSHLRLLLRRFAVTQNSEDAIIFANATLRAENPGPITIWKFVISPEHFLPITELFLVQKSAYQSAFNWLRIYKEAGSRFTNLGSQQTPEQLLEQLKEAIDSNDMSSADGTLSFLNQKLYGTQIEVVARKLFE